MSCTYYQNDSLHTLSQSEIEDHIKTCSKCAERISFESKIIKEASRLTPISPSTNLWSKIESELEEKSKPKNVFTLFSKHKFLFAAAASLILLASMSAFYLLTPVGQTGILSQGALVKVEITEQNYLNAIEQLEEDANNVLVVLDTDLMLLYRDKLETIQSQINRCREAINIK